MENKATWVLVTVALLWALTFPLIGNVIKDQDPFLFVALRFSFAALLIFPLFLKKISVELLMAGGILGILNCASYLCQTIGLKYVSPSRSAFITGTYVIFIPFIAPFFKLQNLKKSDVISAIVCTLGLYVLTGADFKEFSYGDSFVLLGSFIIAVTISYVATLSKNNFDPLSLASSQIIFTSLLAWIMCLFFADYRVESLQRIDFIGLIIYCSIFCTILTFFLQIKYQKYVPTQKVALIFCLEPVFATLFDYLINQTQIQTNLIVGGSLILLSILLVEFKSLRSQHFKRGISSAQKPLD